MAPEPSLKPPSDETIAVVAQAQDMVFNALAGKSFFVRAHKDLASKVTGLTSRTFIPSVVVAADVLLGPIQFDAVTQLDEYDAALNTASNITGAMMCNLAPCAHRPPMPAPRALRLASRAGPAARRRRR